MNSTTTSSRTALAGIALMIAGIFLFAVNDALGKWLMATYSVGQVLLIRSLAAMVLLAPFIWRDVASFAAAPRWGLQVLRALSRDRRGGLLLLGGGLSAARGRHGLLPRGPDLRHRDRRHAAGRAGRLAALERGGGGLHRRDRLLAARAVAAFTWPALIALIGSFTFSLSMISTRFLRGTSGTVLVTTQTVAALVFGDRCRTIRLGAAELPRDLALLVVLGMVAMVAHVCVNRSLTVAPASTVVPYQYTTIVCWAVLFGLPGVQ